ncbi:FOCADHESIN FAMILY MEMBER [Salix koriyanagi]|uniref:FOCADHESIN FAMILY MEMBER n=1 Tax=Salix koriyanagi TaxID=2511006 RepID=A0A9Q1ALK6_9ROSI|nr:FOCADHESIN FAMILY MEMBER [Salix koriyanagi]
MLNSKSKDIWNLLVEVVAALQYADGSFKRQWLVDAVEISCVSSYPSTALLFLGLLSGSCCKYGSLLTLDQLSLLSDLPVTLPSLVTEPSWEVVAESFVSSLWTSTERIYYWVTEKGLPDNTSSAQPIDGSEKDIASFLLHVMYHTCICLKEYLPLEKQLKLANMLVT